MNGTCVAIFKSDEPRYPQKPPFDPAVSYPEYQFGTIGSERNCVYDAVRQCFRLMELDKGNYDTPHWNPLRGLICPGETVLLKPNLVAEQHPRDPGGWQYTLTHGSIVRAVADYVWKAMDGRGRIILADAPQTDSSWEQIIHVLNLDTLQKFYSGRGFDFQLLDLRQEVAQKRNGVMGALRPLPGDPIGNCDYDLGAASEFAGHNREGRYYGAYYDTKEVNAHHNNGRHEYRIAASAMACDVVFNLPKLKTHKKAGITVGLKNLVGVNGNKNWLPHHTEGAPDHGGDEHPNPNAKHKIERMAVAWLHRLAVKMPSVGLRLLGWVRRTGTPVFGDSEDVIRSGNWWGNDTIWRTCLDLNKIVMYGNIDGTMRAAEPQNRKRYLALVDGIIAGEGRGPMNPDPVPAGIVIFGSNPATVDAVCACLMGFDPERIPIVRQAFRCRHFPLADCDWHQIKTISNYPAWNDWLPAIPYLATYHFKPHFGWIGHVERTPKMAASSDQET